MIFLVYSVASLFYVFVLFPAYYPNVMARYSLFVLKVPSNPKQTNKQEHWTCIHTSPRYKYLFLWLLF